MTITPRVFTVTYNFLSCGRVFTDGLVNAASALGIDYAHAGWDAPDLLAQVKRFNPSLLFVIHGRKFAQRFPKLEVFGAPTALWSLDDPYEVDDVASWSKRFTNVFTNDPSTLHRHERSSYLPVCHDPVVHTPGNGSRPHAVGFIGGGNATRDRYLSALAAQGLLTYVIGGPWDAPSVQRVCRSGNIPASETPDWYRDTRIVLNIWRERHHFNREKIPATSLNPRVYESTACGCLVISEWRPELDTLCPEMPTFKSEAECVGLVRAALADPEQAEKIRQQCMARLTPHTYAARLQTVLQTCGLEVAA